MTFGQEKSGDGDNKKDPGAFYMGRMRPPPEPQRVLPRGLLSIIVVIAFIGIIWYAYPEGEERYENVDVPIITADSESYKAKPEEPGGMVVPHQDSTVFDSLDKTGGAEKVERLLPPQEEPMDTGTLGLKLEPTMTTAQKETPPAEKTAPEPEEEAVKTEVKTEPAPAPVVEKEEAAPDAAPPPATTTAATSNGDTYIQLGSYSEADSAKKGWATLQKKYAAQLSDLQMRAERVDLGVKGVFHRLQAGPLTPEKAETACAAIKKAGGACIVVK